MRYAIKSTRGTIILNIKLIKEYGNYRPDRIMVNENIAERQNEWRPTASGNELYYKVGGITYPIRQDALRDCKDFEEPKEREQD